MTYLQDERIDTVLRKVGAVAITIGGVPGIGCVDLADEELLRGERADLVGKVIAVTVRTTAFSGFPTGTALVTGGVTYYIREPLQQGFSLSINGMKRVI